MPDRIRKANSVKSKVWAFVEHVFAQQKVDMALYIPTIGIERAETKIMLVNLAYNMQRLFFHERGVATGSVRRISRMGYQNRRIWTKYQPDRRASLHAGAKHGSKASNY
ncbi:hypothetical protein CHN51_05950 [Sphingorhabdus sp. YGSMI21]|nr:hypothetical protein CHN51_05950 [Sphingorhabdus sp. YGSMI21]